HACRAQRRWQRRDADAGADARDVGREVRRGRRHDRAGSLDAEARAGTWSSDMTSYGDLLPGARILLGPGPTMADPRVLRAMSIPLLGQFDPEFTQVMNEVMELSRFVFQTQNARCYPVSGTGRAGLEAAIVSVVEPGDRVVVGECGRFGLLLIEIAERCGADVVAVRGSWGRVLDPAAIGAALREKPTKLVAMIHGETSTGVLQPLPEIARLAHEYDALLMADAVVTLGGAPVATDDW